MNGNPAISHVINPIKALDHSLVMGDHDNGRLLRASEMPEQIHHGFAPLGIECSGRLVRQNHRRIVNHRAGNRNSLLFSARQRGGIDAGAMAEIETL